MKYVLMVLIGYSSLAQATQVRGYVKRNGTYVSPYQRTDSDYTKTNNYSYDSNSYDNNYNTNDYSKRYDNSNYQKDHGFGSMSDD